MKYQCSSLYLLVLPIIIGTPTVTAQQPHKTLAPTVLPRPSSMADSAKPQPATWRLLFDGHSFTDWEGETKQTWRIENGAIVGGSLQDALPHNEFLCTKREFKNFHLRLKVKLIGTEGFINGGIQFRSQRTKEPAYEMSGYQADMGVGYWASLYDESRRNRTLVQPSQELLQRVLKVDDWNDYEIRCESSRIRLWLNHELMVDFTEPDANIAQSGVIGLQIHGGSKAEASYKDISIRELP